ncbi:MAG TPA: tetratricopeptide repeat protein [Chloroflexia bacterium]|nr:tetratricopeptide repeat protein [Chloroflexia bacterium]
MPKYEIEHKNDLWNGEHVVVKRSPTGGEVATTGIALGAALLVRAHENSKFKTAIAAGRAAQEYLAKGEYEQASASALTLINMSDPEAQLSGHYLKASAQFGLGRYDEAITACTRALGLASTTNHISMISDAYIIRGRCYLGKEDLATAMRDFSSYIRQEPNEDLGYFWLSYSLSELGDFDQALSNINRAVSVNPSDPINYRERAYIHTQCKEHAKAVEDLSRCIKLAPNTADFYRRRSTAYEALGDTEHALEDITRAIELAPGEIDYYQRRLRLYELTGDSTHAAADKELIKAEEPVQKTYQQYLDASLVAYNKGITSVYTHDDAVLRPRWGGAIAQIAFLVVVGLFALTICANFTLQTRQSPIGITLLGLGVLVALIVGVIRSTQTQAKNTVKAATEYLQMLNENNSQLPGFEEFFKQYLQARKESRLQELSARTRPFFESGPGSRVVQQYAASR